MLKVGRVTYAGQNYFLHISTNGSKVRYILFSVYSKEVRDKIEFAGSIEERENYARMQITSEVFHKNNVRNLTDFLIAAFQSDKRGTKTFFLGDTHTLNRIVEVYNKINGNDYHGNDNIKVTDNGVDRIVEVKLEKFDEFVSYIDTLQFGDYNHYKANLSFHSDDVLFVTTYELPDNCKTETYKTWEWTEGINFDAMNLRRQSISMSAKTLDQLRTEKDLSWYFNPDGTSKKDYRVLHTMEEVKECVDQIEKMRNCILLRDPRRDLPVAVDCETTGLNMNKLPWYTDDGERNPLKDEIGGMTLTWKDDQGVYIPFIHTKFQNVPREECLEYLKPYLTTWYLETHNGLFDGKAFMSHGLELNIKDDSMIMLFNINPTVAKGSKGLKENTIVRYGHETLDHDDVFPSKKDVSTFYDLPEDIVRIYGCADGDYCHKLCRDLRKEIPSQAAYRLDMNVMKYLVRVNYNGNKIDGDLLEKLSTVTNKDIETIEELMFKFVGQISTLTRFDKTMQMALKAGKTNEEEIDKLRKELMHTDEFINARYEFVPSQNEKLCNILYNMLNYPITRVSKTSGKPTADKYALKDLSKEIVDVGKEGTWLKEDVMSAVVEYGVKEGSVLSSADKVLIDAGKFNSMKYPFVMLLLKWKELMKLKTTFFAWFQNGACDNYYFSDFSMTNAETSRIIGRIQTLKGAMKQLVVPFSNEYYLMGVDFSQIEARLMAYLSGAWDLVERLCNPRADYHVESAAVLTGKESWQITKSERGDLKSVNFAVPYGMAEYSLAENLYGRPVTQEKVEKARLLLAQWKKSNWQIQAFLDSFRKFAKERHTVKFWDKDTKKFEVKQMRYVPNKKGRRRYFEEGIYAGDKLDSKTLASIDRMAGNYPIQSFAAEIFKTAFVNICKRLDKEGLSDKVFINALVHDEFLMNVHRSVDKYKLYEILWEEMVQSIYLPYKDENGNWMKDDEGNWVIDKEHPRKFFFAGISIGPEWHDIHGNDAHEAPTEYLMYMVDRIKSGDYQFKSYESGDVATECFNETKGFMQKLIIDECYKIQPDISADNVQFYRIVPAFFDYFLKGKLKIYGNGIYRDVEKDNDADDIRARLEALMFDYWHCKSLVCYDENSETSRIVWNETADITEEIDSTISTIDNTVADVEMSDMFDELFDDDLGNFEDGNNTDDYEGFNISIPVGAWKVKDEDEVRLVGRRISPDDKRNIWDLMESKAEVKTYSAVEERRVSLRSNSMYINVVGSSIDDVRKLLRYLGGCNSKNGNYQVKLQTAASIKDTGVRLDSLNRDEVYKIMNWSIME